MNSSPRMAWCSQARANDQYRWAVLLESPSALPASLMLSPAK
jgi:hypothetical protein